MADKNAHTAPSTDDVTSREQSVKPRSQPRRRTSRLVWGLLLVAIGLMALLDNLGIIDVHLINLWRAWPLIVVGFGLSFLSFRGWLGALITTLFIALSLGTIVYVAMVDVGEEAVRSSSALIQRVDEVERAQVNVKSGAGKLTITSDADNANVAQAELSSNFAQLNEESSREGDTQVVRLSTKGTSSWWRGDWRNDLDVRLTETLPMSLSLDVGASKVEADLARVQLTDLNVKAGASDLVLTLGDRVDELNTTIDAGASSIRVRVPKTVDVRVVSSGGLSNADLADLQETNDGQYETESFDQSNKRIIITADIGLANLHLERY